MPGFFIDYLSGERAGAIDTFDKDVVRVGRAPEFELIFDEMGVSWEHAEIRKRDGDFWVIDRGSTNGTYVNDERAHNARLRDGDVLKFGKKGPVLRFRRAPAPTSGRFNAVAPAGPPPPAAGGGPGFPAVDPIVPVNSVEPPAPSQPVPAAVRRPTRRLSEPVMPALPSPRDEVLLEARSDLPPAAPRRTGPSPWTLAATLSLGVLALAGGGTAGLLYVEMRQQDQALSKERDRRAELEREVKAARTQFEEQLLAARRGRSDAEAETARQQAEVERVKRRGEEEAQRQNERVTELERDLQQARALLQRISREERPEPARPQPPPGPAVAGDWKAIDRRLSQSVVFIATQLEGRKADGTTVPMHGFGTGFFASASGHIVTNKHVIEPWKFREMAERMAVDGIEIVEGSYQIHVWIAGTRFLRDRNMDLSTGYSTATKTLEVVRTAPDRWEQVQLGGAKGPRSIRYHNDNCNEDLAILRAHVQSPVTPAPMGTSDSVERLDEVMVLGFPAGPMILEAGVAETSPATGQVRKIEQTIFVSAAMIGGNSGGPLIDRHGRVVGISTRVANGTETLGSCLRIEHATSLLQGGAW
ncbi:MAG: trypsin-like peptidase domain-containing protein [Trueperaceae bacterium]|jgi:pSer/pThr/pTyr-binding forkhead associated (FHA) protein|nr:trypsin-like peptidase domain-containing protein [Trueperaceae bacterium]